MNKREQARRHREQAVSGLRELADFLEEFPVSARLNTTPVTINYVVLEDHIDEARYAFTRTKAFMGKIARRSGTDVVVAHEEYQGTVQHTAVLKFGGAVQYRMVWIEPLPEQAERPEAFPGYTQVELPMIEEESE
jgi:hypothetical protein